MAYTIYNLCGDCLRHPCVCDDIKKKTDQLTYEKIKIKIKQSKIAELAKLRKEISEGINQLESTISRAESIKAELNDI